MLRNLSRLTLIAMGASVVWFIAFSAVALSDWNHRAVERDRLYEQCLEETPNVEECRSLRASTMGEDLRDDLRDFSIMAVAPVVVLWGVIWFVRRRQSRQTGASA